MSYFTHVTEYVAEIHSPFNAFWSWCLYLNHFKMEEVLNFTIAVYIHT